MILPQFTLRMVLALMAVLGFVSLIVSRGLQGSAWAMGVSVALAALVFAFGTYAAAFGLVFVLSRVRNSHSSSPAPSAARAPHPSIAINETDDLHLTPLNES
jgi:amino acid transporter